MPKRNQKILYIGDNLPIMMGMESEMVDLIYTDPPFKTETFRKGKTEEHSFDDTWSKAEVDYAHAVSLKFQYPQMWQMIVLAEKMHSKAMHNYLAFMGPRIVQMHRLLKPSGSLYLHCDDNANFYLRMLLDCVFGTKNFRNEIVWCYPPKGRASKYGFHRKHDTIFLYAKSGISVFERPYTKLNSAQIAKFSGVTKDGRRYKEFKGKRTYLDTSKDRPVPSWWTDIAATGQSRKEYTGYDTQKPLALAARIVKASSNEGDLVLDPFCGCATACLAAAGLSRNWIGIDQNKKATSILRDRLKQYYFSFDFETNSPTDSKLQKPLRLPKRKVTGYQKISIKQAKLNLLQADYREYGYTFCRGCLDKVDEKHLNVDHILAKAKGGLDELINLQLLCTPCNSKKGEKDMEFLYRILDAETRQKRLKIRSQRDLLTKDIIS